MPGVNGRGYGLPAAPAADLRRWLRHGLPEAAAKSRKPHRIAVRAKEC